MIQQNPFVAEEALNDQELVAQIRAGNREALETLIKRHQSKAHIFHRPLQYISSPEPVRSARVLMLISKRFNG